VRRSAGPWTPAVHALLAHLRSHGFPEAPDPLGIDELGHEVLGYIDGDVPMGDPLPAWTRSDEALIEVARLVRRFHDASKGFVAPDASWQRLPGAPGGSEVMCHNDLAPYNTVYRHGGPVAFIDWEYAAPGTRMWDLAHAAWRHVPLGSQIPVAQAAARLRLFCDAYGLRRRAGLLDVIALRQQVLHDTVRQFAVAGIPAFVAMWGTAHSEQPLRDRRHLLAHRATYAAALA
jgi:aminoglycoside phosphotransferase (APT) family kinase protein